MPYIEKSIVDLDITVTRQVMMSVVSTVLKHTNVRDSKDIKISYLGDSDVELEPGSYLAEGKRDSISYGSHGKITIEAREEENPDYILSMSSNLKNEQPLIEDKHLNFSVTPDYSMKTVTIEFKYRAATENAANDWANNILRRLNKSVNYMPHEIQYNLMLNKEYLALMFELYNKREAQAGFGESFKDWFDRICIVPPTIVSTMDGDERAITFPQVAATVYGNFDIAARPQVKRDESSNVFESSLTYSFEYGKPHSLIAKYPLVVHNQVIDSAWINTDALYDSSKFPGFRSHVQQNFIDVMKRTRMESNYEAIIQPHFDDWNNERAGDSMSLIFRTMCKIDSDDLTKLCDLNSLGKFKLTPSFYSQIEDYKERVMERDRWFVYLTAYEDDRLMSSSDLYVDDQMVVRSRKELNLRKTYRFCIYMLSDYSILESETIEAMRKEPIHFYENIIALDPTIVERNITPKLYASNTLITSESFATVVKNINRSTIIDTRFYNRICVLMNRVLIEVHNV